MKRIFLIGLVILLLPVVVDATTYTPVIDVETGYTDPYPVEPGNNFELWIVILNSGFDKAEDISVEIKASEPFTVLENPKKQIKVLNYDDSRVLDYDLFVDSSAVSTTYNIPVQIKYDDGSLIKRIEIDVQGTPKFKLLNLDSEMISPGDQTDISVWIQNVGTGKAKRATATFSSSSEYVEPIFSGGNVYIGDVEPKEKKRIGFEIMASSDSEYGVYSGSINVSYEDESGNELSTKFDVGILISGEPKLQVYKIETDIEESDLTVEIVNIGGAEAKAIAAKLIIDGEVLDVDYVTSIKIDRRSTLKFTLPKSTKGKLELSYEGPDNKQYSQTEDITWIISSTFPTWIVVIVVLIVVYVLWKKKWYKKIF